MVETDWRQIVSFSQRELNEGDKEKLCESLSWMEADDIELNFSDLKTLFRLAQDILKYKTEQVNNLLGELESTQRKREKNKSKVPVEDSPTRSSDSVIETIAHQEEIIKANKDILAQLYSDIAELEGRKNKLDKDQDRESESSRDALSEMNAIEQLEREATMKNRHIRKLLSDVKNLEEENSQLKEKTSILKDKLTEATQIIENLTEQLSSLNSEMSKLKEVLGKVEESKADLTMEIEKLKMELSEKDMDRSSVFEEVRSKAQHWKNIARSKKAENEALVEEIQGLKEDLKQAIVQSPVEMVSSSIPEKQLEEFQYKLKEATNEMLKSAEVIELLKADNKRLKATLKEIEAPDTPSLDTKNESDDGKERIMINKLKKRVNNLTDALRAAEESVSAREEELAIVTSQLQLLESGEEGLGALLQSLKSKKRQLRLKDEGIKSLVQDVNALNELNDELQLQNEAMREKLNIPRNANIATKGILKKYQDIEQQAMYIQKELKRMEDKNLTIELEKRNITKKMSHLVKHLQDIGCNADKIEELCASNDSDSDIMPNDGGGEGSIFISKKKQASPTKAEETKNQEEIQAIVDENEGLRKGLREILDFLKDNSTTSSGVLALQCSSLEAVLNSMEARHSAGWVAPHMSALLELKAALGGRDALLTALHDARKETFNAMNQLAKESQKVEEYERKLCDLEKTTKPLEFAQSDLSIFENDEFGTWMSGTNVNNIDVSNKDEIENIIANGKLQYENKLKNCLSYFHNKFSALFDKMTEIAIQSDNERNKWALCEENYKAEIEHMKILLSQREDDETSDDSPGIINYPAVNVLQRKCTFLEESYKYVRTQTENIKNEYLESKKEILVITAEYELKIQKLILYISNMTDQLRKCVSVELFWKQNEVLTEMTSNYRNIVDKKLKDHVQTDLLEYFEKYRLEIIENLRKTLHFDNSVVDENDLRTVLSSVEQTVLQNQVKNLCEKLKETCNKLKSAEIKILDYQEAQSKIIDQTLAKTTNEEIAVMKEQLEKLAEDNKILTEKSNHVSNQLEIALLQLHDSQQQQMSNDIEVNMLRHQILDLQSASDNKAIIARLSSEILVTHLQSSEMTKKIDRLNTALEKEIQRRIKAEEMLKAREKIFDVYAHRYASKFRYMFEVIQILRQQYQGCLPLISVENYLNSIENQYRKSHDVEEKLNEIEDLRSNLLMKHNIFNEILNDPKLKCLEDEGECEHKLQLVVTQSVKAREIDLCNKKIQTLEQSRHDITRQCNKLEKSLVLVNHGFGVLSVDEVIDTKIAESFNPNLEVEDVQSDEESRKSDTITLPKPNLLKSPKNSVDMTNLKKDDLLFELPGSPGKEESKNKIKEIETVNAFVQTATHEKMKRNRQVQTEANQIEVIDDVRKHVNELEQVKEKTRKELADTLRLTQQQSKEISMLSKEKINLEKVISNLKVLSSQKDKTIINLQETVRQLNEEITEYQNISTEERSKEKVNILDDTKSLLDTLKNLENDKNAVVEEYKEILKKEREEYLQSVRDFNKKITILQSQVEEKSCKQSNADTVKEAAGKYSDKIVELEDKCFKLQSELDGCKTYLSSYQTEAQRWKDLANERLTKMEQLNSQLQERHCQEVQSYKSESQHWLAQLNESQRGHLELRSKLTDQKTAQVKLLAEKDSVIEHLRSVVQNLKVQIMSMQAMMSAHDPSFDMSAIVEVEDSDGTSQRGSDRLEIRFDSSPDLREDRPPAIPATSTAIWQESIIERLRRERQFTAKQNSILRKQIKTLAARERRARLEAQNLKNQVYRISTSGSKAVTAESASLQTKIVSLQAQLSSARRDSHSSVALWDKWKRAQQASERWQAKFEEKCREVHKVETSLNLTKSVVTRLEKEKRVLLNRLSEVTNDKPASEKQELERPEKFRPDGGEWQVCGELPCRPDSPERHQVSGTVPAHVSARSLLERVAAQQRRIAALELAQQGNEPLVSEYERCLAENTALKGQVLKLESTLLEMQLRSPYKSATDLQPELEYWKSYCDMLKEENTQLTVRVNSAETGPHQHQSHRVNDLEQTVLTLRGLVSKLQSEQKSSASPKRFDSSSRPGSAHSFGDKAQTRSQLESYRTELANLKRSMLDKDNLLERSKEMLNIAAEREDELLREVQVSQWFKIHDLECAEPLFAAPAPCVPFTHAPFFKNACLRRRLNELTKPKSGCFSA